MCGQDGRGSIQSGELEFLKRLRGGLCCILAAIALAARVPTLKQFVALGGTEDDSRRMEKNGLIDVRWTKGWPWCACGRCG